MIIFVNGSINSGKSTVAKLLALKLPRTALLEIDALCECIAWMPLAEAIPINLENAISVIKNFVKRDINVVVPYPLSQKNYDFLIQELKLLNQDIFVFTLNPPLEIALTNRGERELTVEEQERIKYHYEIGINKPNFGTIIDNSKQTPEETVGIIMKSIV
ncbi:MAG: hypothetical protein PHH40_00795 [Candidatus Moranbacteria bacterium]|nr:hypothetical protein [Candidatus Moranbacteria bacterium]MDD3964851.1 hypothetical protein [Candidatus Moranbacteria bacterium]